MITFDALRSAHVWQPIHGCPGRFVLVGAASDLDPRALLDVDAKLTEHRVPAARDAVCVCALDGGGGLLSYHRADGSWLHTLATPEGLARKLTQLGIDPIGAQRDPRE